MRVKLLIKNMFENKAKNWTKSKSENSQVLKKDEIAKKVTKEAEEKRKLEMGVRDDFGGRGAYSDRNQGKDDDRNKNVQKRGSNKDNTKEVYMEKKKSYNEDQKRVPKQNSLEK